MYAVCCHAVQLRHSCSFYRCLSYCCILVLLSLHVICCHFMCFSATVCKTVRPMLSDRCLSVLSCLSVCDVRALWPNGLTDQDETLHAGILGPGHIVLDGDPAPLTQRGIAPPPFFSPYLLRPNGCMDRDITWYGARSRPRRLVLDEDPAPPLKGGRSPLPNFRRISIVGKRLDASRCHLVWM